MVKRKSFPKNSRQQFVLRKQVENASKVKICVVTEGSVTEIEYLDDWMSQYSSPNRSKIRVVSSSAGTDPLSVYNEAVRYKKDVFRNAIMFIMIDEDDRLIKIPNNINAVLGACNLLDRDNPSNGKINCIYSNRSFDFWGLLHFEDTDSPSLNKKNLRDRLRKSENLGASYDSSDKRVGGNGKRFSLADLKSRGCEDDAFIRAKKIRRNNGCLERSVTNVDELLGFLKKFLNNEISL